METAFLGFIGKHNRPTTLLVRAVRVAGWIGVVIRFTCCTPHNVLAKAAVLLLWAAAALEGMPLRAPHDSGTVNCTLQQTLQRRRRA